MTRWLWIVGLVLALPAHGAVERIEVAARAPFADGAAFGDVGAYEKITGRLHYAIDPAHPANAEVVDLHLARRDGDGLVRFAGDFVLLRPADPARGNRRLLYEVGNRGGLGMVTFFNAGTQCWVGCRRPPIPPAPPPTNPPDQHTPAFSNAT